MSLLVVLGVGFLIVVVVVFEGDFCVVVRLGGLVEISVLG